MIDELNENTTNEDTLEIIVYKNNGKLSGISIKNNDTQISIDKTYNENDLEYKINLTDSNYIIFKYTGLNNNQNITENCEILNKIGIPLTSFYIIFTSVVKIIILCVGAIV